MNARAQTSRAGHTGLRSRLPAPARVPPTDEIPGWRELLERLDRLERER
jgi:hypothetical protein